MSVLTAQSKGVARGVSRLPGHPPPSPQKQQFFTIGWATFPPTCCENMASHRERIMEKTQKFQIVYEGPTNLCQHSTTDLTRGIMTNERKQSVLLKARSFKHSKTTNNFLYSVYYQRADKTNLFHRLCTFNFINFFRQCLAPVRRITWRRPWFRHVTWPVKSELGGPLDPQRPPLR